MNFDLLPTELLIYLLDFVHAQSQLILARVNKKFNLFVNKEKSNLSKYKTEKITQNTIKLNKLAQDGKIDNKPVLLEEMRQLLQKKADPNRMFPNSGSPFHTVVNRGSLIAVSLLLEFNADVNSMNSAGTTPLHLSAGAYWNKVKISQLLIARGANPNAMNRVDKTPVNIAYSVRCHKLAKCLTTNTGWEEALAEEEKNNLERKRF